MCGGTPGQRRPHRHAGGLSPRVRGNLVATGWGRGRWGSIPACAGEPVAPERYYYPRTVYPRVCGGTSVDPRQPYWYEGLSPRVRGNPAMTIPPWCGIRSIPACAGEPTVSSATASPAAVYPRVCGGTTATGVTIDGDMGLSPRVRGNPAGPAVCRPAPGSIPACAGEPQRPPRLRPPRAVYPRVCGGTPGIRSRHPGIRGLSPRVRGNQRYQQAFVFADGSIPACAGEPLAAAAGILASGVYPRVCGGTVGAGCR